MATDRCDLPTAAHTGPIPGSALHMYTASEHKAKLFAMMADDAGISMDIRTLPYKRKLFFRSVRDRLRYIVQYAPLAEGWHMTEISRLEVAALKDIDCQIEPAIVRSPSLYTIVHGLVVAKQQQDAEMADDHPYFAVSKSVLAFCHSSAPENIHVVAGTDVGRVVECDSTNGSATHVRCSNAYGCMFQLNDAGKTYSHMTMRELHELPCNRSVAFGAMLAMVDDGENNSSSPTVELV